MKIVFMGTPDFAIPSLEKLYNKGYDIELVVTQKDRPRGRGKKTQFPPVKEYSLDLGLSIHQPDNINSLETIDLIRKIKPDFIVVVAFGQLLRKDLLQLPRFGCINLHASLLPKYRGAAPINWAIINGEVETGVTIMEMAEGLDSGDIFSTESLRISDEDEYVSIHNKLAKVGADLLVNTMEKIVKNELIKKPQDHSISTYAPMIYKETGKISWNQTGREIFNLTRGLKPWPGTYTRYKDDILKIHEIDIIPRANQDNIGMITKVSKEGIFVNAKDSQVVIKVLQFPNKRKMKVSDYLAGNNIDVGIVLE